MNLLFLLLTLFSVVLLIVLDASRKLNLMHPLPLTAYLLLAPNLVLWVYWLHNVALTGLEPAWRFAYLVAAGVLILYLWLRLSIFPVLDGQKVRRRLKIMIGGRFITYAAIWVTALELVFVLWGYRFFRQAGVPDSILIYNTVYGVVMILLLLWNGILRMFFTSRRLSIVRRLIMVLTMWIPVVNLVVLSYACRLVYDEYDFAIYKENINRTRVDSDLCATKYPLIMVHGVLFRDLKYFNYWGRIPKELIRYGAKVYYGNQEAVGTIERNGGDICRKIEEVLAETGCDKVNIIAHSKGGLDARYAITALGMADSVASLTSICVPHRGCRFIDLACKLPEGFYRFLAKIFDTTFRKFGDNNPDFYTATRQFSTVTSEEFNRKVPNMPGVYYQSYMTRMKSFLGDSLLSLPYLMIKSLEGQNDGLVSVESSKWGEFRGIITSSGRRGISHGDIIDLKREDYRGFDVVETYVNIVADLKSRGL